MSVIIQCVYATTDNGKLKYAKECLASLAETVDLPKHRLIIVNQNSCEEARTFLTEFMKSHPNVQLINLSENIGTARGINMGLIQRKPGEFTAKIDDDLTWCEKGWVDKMEAEIRKNPRIGILGLRRDDVYGELIPDGNLLWNADIMGTCTMFNPDLVDKVGAMTQFSNLYGYDDSLYSVRSEAAGFKNAFMRHIKIVNLDKGGTAYTEWKKREAAIYGSEVAIYAGMIRSGEVSYYSEL